MTFVIKVRGAGGPMLAEYLCREHGRFEELVTRNASGDPPDEMPCPYERNYRMIEVFGLSGEARIEMTRCLEKRCPHVISAPAVHTMFVVSASQGKSAPKPHAEAMDTRPLAEGRKKEWRQNRKKQRIERRHRRIKELLR